MAMFLSGKGMFSRLWNQIRVELKSKDLERSPEDYMIRSEPNQLLRWGITFVIVFLYVLRIFFFDPGYFVLTLFFGFYYLDHLKEYLFPSFLCVRVASDLAYTRGYAPDGQTLQVQPRIIALFSNQLSPNDFISFVNRILEFKFWFTTMTTILLAFLLTCLPIFKGPSVGSEILLGWIPLYGYQFVPPMMESVKKSKSKSKSGVALEALA